ncbi:methyltransferase [Candidatus Nanopelagicus hibericus]|uniref:Methyltransferase n=1 Tax=Candidatus Nanopelagicus hibericus TaxID=1884915 RepID=A0A249KAW2_9ACTN|nr:FkbM family methyltransferase [Candidatus Nanopelagicus hibericus]ASY13845.1 methyltransferase [Candidatus Nanopelagicus hibericus]
MGKNYCKFMNLFLNKEFKYEFKDHRYYMVVNNKKFYFLRSRVDLYHLGFDARIKGLSNSYNCDFVELSEDELIVDVGANAGEFQFCFPKNNYIGFEPSPLDYEILELNRLTSSSIYNTCISDFDGVVKFYISTESSDSSIYQPLKVEQVIDVQVSRIDTLVKQKIGLIKIDAEGAEFEVLKGCDKLFEKIHYITVDLGFEKGITEDSTFPEVLNLLYGVGFTVIKNSPGNRFLFVNNNF